MEALKRKRTQFRREFSIAADNMEKALQTKDDSSENFSLLSDCAEQLFSCESAIRDLWCEAENFDEAAYQADQDRALEYKKRWSKLKSRFEKQVSSDTDNRSLLSAKSGSDEQKVKLPELEITKFDGNVKKWLSFWGQFKKIDQDPCIADTDKMQYLLQSMEPGSSARNIVASHPPCGENYAKVLGALKSRFAREDVLIETYVRGLLQLMQEKSQPRNSKELSTLYDSLQTHLQALETLGVTKDKYASILFPMVESALPEDVLRAWNRNRSKRQGDTDLSKLVEFLREEVESEERIELARQNSLQAASGTTGVKEPTCCFVSEVGSEKVKSAILCIWCDKDGHSSSECHKANKMSYQQRVEHVKAKKACLICLRQNHMAKRCKSFPECLFCRKRHLTLLCPDIEEQGAACRQKTKEPENSNNLLCGTKRTTLLQTVVVKICSHDRTREILVRGLIDSGAQRSYIRKEVAQQLSLKPSRKEVLTICLFGGKEEKQEERNIYDISVKSLSENFTHQMSVVEQTNICNFVPKLTCKNILGRLQQNNIVLTETVDSPDEVSLLIGADFAGKLLTGDVCQVDNNLTAVRTKLGWTLQGVTTGVNSSIACVTTALHCLTKVDISDLWNKESLGIKVSAERAVNQELVADFNSSTCKGGRHKVRLPGCDVPRQKTNHHIASERLRYTTSRLKQLDKKDEYDEVSKEWLERFSAFSHWKFLRKCRYRLSNSDLDAAKTADGTSETSQTVDVTDEAKPKGTQSGRIVKY